MSKKRTVYSAKRKAEIAIEAIKESLTQAQLSSQHEIHPSQLKSWKQQALSLRAMEGRRPRPVVPGRHRFSSDRNGGAPLGA